MSLVKIISMSSVNTNVNGGYSKLGDRHQDSKMYVEKDGITLVFDNEDIMEFMKAAQFFNPTVQII